MSVTKNATRVAIAVTLASLSVVPFRGYTTAGSAVSADRKTADAVPTAGQPSIASGRRVVAAVNRPVHGPIEPLSRPVHGPSSSVQTPAAAIRDFDLGKVTEGTELNHTFAIRNTTDKPLKVIAIKKSCGCESVNVKEGTVVGPGDHMEVTYALSKYGAGDRKGHLVITTDAEDESLRVIELNIRATVQAKLWTTPAELHLTADDPAKAEDLLRVESTISGLLGSFKDATTNRGNVLVRLKEKTAETLTFTVTAAPEAPWGTSYDLIYLAFDNREKPLLSVRTQIRKGHPLALIPATLKLPALQDNQPLTRKIRILSPSAATPPFHITSVECPAGISVGELPSDPRHTFDVNLTFSSQPPASGDQVVLFHTEPPGAVTLTVRHAATERSIP